MYEPDLLSPLLPLQRRVAAQQRQGLASKLSSSMLSLLSPNGPNAKLTILLFHKLPLLADPLTPDEPVFAQFEHILDFIQEHATVLPLSDAANALAKSELPKKAVSITFDDGYDEWLTTVGPALRMRNMHATFFVTTEQLNGPALWHERIIAAVRVLPDTGARLPYGFGGFSDLRQVGSRIRLISALQERLKYAPLPERLGAIEMIEAQARSPLIWPKPFNGESVRQLHSQGFAIGGHTITHPILNECSDRQAMEEIGECKDELEAIIGGPVYTFAYPNGRPSKDYDGRHVAMVRACGYKAAVATSGGAARQGSDIFQLPRFTPWGVTNERIALQLARNLVSSKRTVTVAMPAATQVDDKVRLTSVRCLMVASTFSPLNGDAARMYKSLCDYMPQGSVRVLTASTSYASGREIEGWHEHDGAAPFPVDRIPLLRPLIQPPPANIAVSLARFAFQDIALYARVLAVAAKLVKRHNINVVCIGELVSSSWLGIALKKIFGTRLVIYAHGEEISAPNIGLLHGNRRKEFLDAADKVIAVSSTTCDMLTQQMGLGAEQVSLVPYGIDTERYTPGERSTELIHRYGLEHRKVVLIMNPPAAGKSAEATIRAMAQVLHQRPDVHYLVIAGSKEKATLQRLFVQENLAANVSLVDHVVEADIVYYLRSCDLILVPDSTTPGTQAEGSGLIFRQASACGKPVVGSRDGRAQEEIIDRQSGFLVNGGDPNEIADRVLAILNDEALAHCLGTCGVEIARRSSTQMVANQFLQICERMLRQH